MQFKWLWIIHPEPFRRTKPTVRHGLKRDRTPVLQFLSRDEWETVLKHWPYYVEKKTEPGRDILNHRMTLHAKVEKQAVSQLKFA
jgi:hypothetical protein